MCGNNCGIDGSSFVYMVTVPSEGCTSLCEGRACNEAMYQGRESLATRLNEATVHVRVSRTIIGRKC